MDKNILSPSFITNTVYCPHILNLYPNSLLSKFYIREIISEKNPMFNCSLLTKPFIYSNYFSLAQSQNFLSDYYLKNLSLDWTAINSQQTLSQNSIVKSGCVFSLSFDDTGEFMASTNHNNTIEIWNMSKKKIEKVITDHQQIVTEVTFFHSNPHFFLSCSLDKTIKLFNNYKCVHTFTEHSDWVRCVNISNSNRFFLSGCVSSVVKLWDLTSRQVISSLYNSEHSSESLLTVNSLEFFRNNDFAFLVGLRDGTVKLCDSRTKKIEVTNKFKAHSTKLNSVKLNKENTYLLSSGRDSTLKIWDLRKIPTSMNAGENECVREYKGHKCNGYNVLCNFYNKEKYIVTGSEDGVLYFYDTGTGAIAHRIKTNQKCVVLANPVPQSQAIAFTGLEDVSIFIWDVRLSLQRGIEREAKKAEKEDEDSNDDKDNEYYALCYKIVEEIMNECSDVIFKIFHQNNVPFSKDINFGNLLEIVQRNNSPESQMILKILNEKIYKSLTENLLKVGLGKNQNNTLAKSKEKIKEKVNEIKCTKCNNKSVNYIQNIISTIDIDLLTFPNHYNFNDEI